MGTIIDLQNKLREREEEFVFNQTHVLAFVPEDAEISYGSCDLCGSYDFYVIMDDDNCTETENYIKAIECKKCKYHHPLGKPEPAKK